jgi:hypothetical protein
VLLVAVGNDSQSVRLASPICVKQAVSWEGVLRFVPLLHPAPDADRREPYRRESVRRAVNGACAAVRPEDADLGVTVCGQAVEKLTWRGCRCGQNTRIFSGAPRSGSPASRDRTKRTCRHHVGRGPAAARPESRRRQVTSSAPDGDGSYLRSRTDRVSSPCARVPPRRLSRGRPARGEGNRDEGARTTQPHRCHGR